MDCPRISKLALLRGHLNRYPEAMETIAATNRTRVVRHAERGVYDREQIHSILDEGYVCHVGFAVDGQPYVLPTAYGRSGDLLYIHGSAASRMLRSLAQGVAVCVTVTLVDGFVLARAAFRHSMNYRSVVVLGAARLVTDPGEKMAALRCFTNHVVPDRWEEVRPPNETEMRSTSVLALPLDEASAKVRLGPASGPRRRLGMACLGWRCSRPYATRRTDPG